jgi:secondary thiamine-phosphate synthase enzyme
MAMMLSTSEVIPVVDGQLALGTWQSVLLFDLDGPRKRTVLIQISGE